MRRSILALPLLLLGTGAASADDYVNGMARVASRFTALRAYCPPYFPLDDDRILRFIGASISVGEKSVGAAAFQKLLSFEQARRQQEVAVTGAEQWCSYQRGALISEGSAEFLVPAKPQRPRLAVDKAASSDADWAVKYVFQKLKESGLVGVNAWVDSCYKAAIKKKSVAAARKCYTLDYTASLVDKDVLASLGAVQDKASRNSQVNTMLRGFENVAQAGVPGAPGEDLVEMWSRAVIVAGSKAVNTP